MKIVQFDSHKTVQVELTHDEVCLMNAWIETAREYIRMSHTVDEFYDMSSQWFFSTILQRDDLKPAVRQCIEKGDELIDAARKLIN